MVEWNLTHLYCDSSEMDEVIVRLVKKIAVEFNMWNA